MTSSAEKNVSHFQVRRGTFDIPGTRIHNCTESNDSKTIGF